MLCLIDEEGGRSPSGKIKIQTALDRGTQILEEELKRLGCSKKELKARRKNDPGKLALAARLRKETTLTIKAIAELAQIGTSRSANTKLHAWMSGKANKNQGNGRIS